MRAKDRYYALSYCWGARADMVPIRMHGYSHNVTRNLDSALRQSGSRTRQFRFGSTSSVLIRRARAKEKQITLMRQIYSGADSVGYMDRGGE